MNILAHAYLSGPDEGVIVGNFIGDFVKGDPTHPRHGLTDAVRRGVYLHRLIDSFTDEHPVTAGLREVLRPRCHKYAGPALDVILDHFMALRFEQYAQQPLAVFVQGFYAVIQKNFNLLPVPALRMADYMIRHDWLTHYAMPEGIDRALKGIARRTTFPSGMDTAIDDLLAHYAIFADGFDRFFPELHNATRHFLLNENA